MLETWAPEAGSLGRGQLCCASCPWAHYFTFLWLSTWLQAGGSVLLPLKTDPRWVKAHECSEASGTWLTLRQHKVIIIGGSLQVGGSRQALGIGWCFTGVLAADVIWDPSPSNAYYLEGLMLSIGSHRCGSPQLEFGFCHSRSSVLMASVGLRTGRGGGPERRGCLSSLHRTQPPASLCLAH